MDRRPSDDYLDYLKRRFLDLTTKVCAAEAFLDIASERERAFDAALVSTMRQEMRDGLESLSIVSMMVVGDYGSEVLDEIVADCRDQGMGHL